MKIYFVAESLEYGELLGIVASLQGDDVPHGQIRNAIRLPGKEAPFDDVERCVQVLRQLADWIEQQTPKPAFQLIDSPIFGKTREPTDEERAAIRKFVEEVPVGVFQELNKALRERGLMITIDAHPAGRT